VRSSIEKGADVIGTLPTRFDDVKLTNDQINQIAEVYTQAVDSFIALENQSRYPKTAFYDTAYHLRETFQIQHTRALASRTNK